MAGCRAADAARRDGRNNHLISGYVDIHAHLLPGLDDGPPDLEEALAMGRAAAGSAVTTIATTPHLNPGFPDVRVEEIAARCAQLRQAFGREEILLEVVPAAEISLTWALEASAEQLGLASYAQRGSDLLIEAPFSETVGLDRFLYQLRARGYRITLAHPERNARFKADPGSLRPLVEQGVLLQLNADSLLGPGSGRGTKRAARELLVGGLAHVIASDGHRGAGWRPVTRLAQAVDAAAELVGVERARWMTRDAPAAIIAGAELPAPPPIVARAQRRLFRRR